MSGNLVRKSNINHDTHWWMFRRLWSKEFFKMGVCKSFSKQYWLNVFAAKNGKIPRKYLCMFHVTSTNSAEWISVWMIKSHWSANTRRENLLPEILIRGDKKTKISQFVLFVREHVLKVSLGQQIRGEIWQIPAKTAIGQLISYHPPKGPPLPQFSCNFVLPSRRCIQTVGNLQIFPNPLSRLARWKTNGLKCDWVRCQSFIRSK